MNRKEATPIHEIERLILSDLKKKKLGLPSGFAMYAAEVAALCLEHQNHKSGISLSVDGDYKQIFITIWGAVDDHTRQFYSDLPEATHYGAYGVAALLVFHLTDLRVTAQSYKSTGFDFWLAPKSSKGTLFQNKMRLEVSGTLHEKYLKGRTKRKHEQTKQSDELFPSIPAMVIVVEFSKPRVRMEKR